MKTCDFLVVGGGIIGINVAWKLKKLHPSASVVVVEKEPAFAAHASGRNSGVLHAGFYYTANSLKAKFTRVGNRLLTEYCERKKLPIRKCGKLVVAKDAADLPQLDELIRRGRANQVDIDVLTAEEAKKIEPRVKTFERALFSPTTSSVDPTQVTLSMKDDAARDGVEFKPGEPYVGRTGSQVRTRSEVYSAGYVVNCAGLYADKIALDFGFSQEYRILPFKGLYLYSEEHEGAFRTNIYPVPDLKNPFLGVHFTITVDGHVKIGPTAIPALWREQYESFKGFQARELADIALRQAGLFLSAGFDFRKLALQEVQKYSRKRMVELASVLAEGVRVQDYLRWGRPGIRAQLLNVKMKKLEMDFVLQGDSGSFHILNAVSPGFTCSLPFSEYVVEQISACIEQKQEVS